MASRRPLALVSGAVSELPTGDTVPGSAVDLSGLASLYQALDATLTALAGLATGANKFPYSTGTDTFSQADITAAGRALLDDADAAAQIVTLGLAALFQPLDGDLTTIAAITSGTGNVMAADGSGWVAKSYTALKTALVLVAADVGLGNVDNTSNSTERAAARTLTNARITKRIGTTTTSSSLTIDSNSYDQYNLTAQSGVITVNAPTGTPTDAQQLMIRIKCPTTIGAITWNAAFRALGVTNPTTTVVGKTTYVGCMWNAADSVWDVLATGQQA